MARTARRLAAARLGAQAAGPRASRSKARSVRRRQQRETLRRRDRRAQHHGRAHAAGRAGRDRPADPVDQGKPGPLRAARSAHRRGRPRDRRAAAAARRRARGLRADPITALPNRARSTRRWPRRSPRPPRRASRSRCMLCNLDYFTAFNENFGSYHGRPGAALDRHCCSRRTCAPATRSRASTATQFAAILPQHARDARRSPARNVSARC